MSHVGVIRYTKSVKHLLACLQRLSRLLYSAFGSTLSDTGALIRIRSSSAHTSSRSRLRRNQVEVSRIIAEIDSQIQKLQQARELLAGMETTVSRGPGRPKGSKSASAKTNKRRLSPEGRKRISETMKRRWADRRKALAKSGNSGK